MSIWKWWFYSQELHKWYTVSCASSFSDEEHDSMKMDDVLLFPSIPQRWSQNIWYTGALCHLVPVMCFRARICGSRDWKVEAQQRLPILRSRTYPANDRPLGTALSICPSSALTPSALSFLICILFSQPENMLNSRQAVKQIALTDCWSDTKAKLPECSAAQATISP